MNEPEKKGFAAVADLRDADYFYWLCGWPLKILGVNPAHSPAPAPAEHATVQVPAPSIIKTPVAQMTAAALAPVEEAELTEHSLTDTAAPVFLPPKPWHTKQQPEQKIESNFEPRPQEKFQKPKSSLKNSSRYRF